MYCIDNKEDDPVLTRNTDQKSDQKGSDYTYYRLLMSRCNQKEQDDIYAAKQKAGTLKKYPNGTVEEKIKCSSSAEVDEWTNDKNLLMWHPVYTLTNRPINGKYVIWNLKAA